MKKQQDGSPTRMRWIVIDDGHVRIELECLLVSAPGILTNLARGLRYLAQEQDPEGLAVADAVNAISAELVAEKIKVQDGNG
jgi:hypothetical protein